MDEITDLEDLECVDEVIDYKQPDIDKSVIINAPFGVQIVRAEFLRHLREEWKWEDSHYNSHHDTGYVLLNRRV